jgi:hypothetical protein
MLFASLWQPAPQGPIERSSAFQALDSAEKSAVNHFLGGIAAKLAADGLFGGAWLAHLDQVLRAHGIPVRGSRPDFLGTDLFGCQLVVEAKGHSRLDPRTVAAPSDRRRACRRCRAVDLIWPTRRLPLSRRGRTRPVPPVDFWLAPLR